MFFFTCATPQGSNVNAPVLLQTCEPFGFVGFPFIMLRNSIVRKKFLSRLWVLYAKNSILTDNLLLIKSISPAASKLKLSF